MASRIHREVYVRFWREYGTVEVDDRLCLPHEKKSGLNKKYEEKTIPRTVEYDMEKLSLSSGLFCS